jgi:hypothetical protein
MIRRRRGRSSNSAVQRVQIRLVVAVVEDVVMDGSRT